MDEPHDVEDAPDGTEYALGAFPAPSLDDCPLTPLGAYESRIVLGMPDGEIRDEKAADVARLLRVDLFNCAAGQAFLTTWRDANDKFQRDLAAIWLVRQCREAGYWDKSRPQRSLGVWPGLDGAVVLHKGDALWQWAERGALAEVVSIANAMRARTSGPVYRLRSPTPAPERAASALDGVWIRDRLDLWRFDPIGEDGLSGADLVAGWLMASLLGAVAPFRPHMLLYAMAGSGKTTLIRFVHALLSALAGDVIDNFTEAGLANDLAGMARPVIIDEAEATPSAFGGLGPIEKALQLIRRMATGEGATKKQGALGGGSVTQTAVGAVLLAAVNPAKLDSADASRIAEASLSPIGAAWSFGVASKLATDAELKAAIARARELAPALLGRALAGSWRYLDEVAALKAAFARQGHSPRAADLVSALAAGRRLLMSDAAIDEASADDEARFWSGMLQERAEAEIVSNPGEDCLQHLFAWPSGKAISDRVAPISDLIRRVCVTRSAQTTDESDGHNAEVLREFGLKVTEAFDEQLGRKRLWLLVANKHPALSKVFERTAWRDWRRTLGYLAALGPDYAPAIGKTQRFGLTPSRTLAVPLDPWLGTALTLLTATQYKR